MYMYYSSRISHLFREAKSQRTPRNLVWPSIFARKIPSLFQTGSLLQHGNRVFRSDSAHAQTGRDPTCLYACAFILIFMGVSVISEKGSLQQTYSCSWQRICTALEGLSLSVKTHRYRHINTNFRQDIITHQQWVFHLAGAHALSSRNPQHTYWHIIYAVKYITVHQVCSGSNRDAHCTCCERRYVHSDF